ncbi:MAG: 16S rRNA (uracil(1498)-N(3))-methyltransferase [Eubacterium sp.]|nr:16S rRNA (uracil(1498)-N(3))-methyltransferase [Eubacterium sp.]MCM1213818.1 16S rRNA (uracil(1498)-N(3))-methyltransferase [Lachnospiraceae bacterium]MCM1303303.1 16S rRNA (uracil(1498)-N(3))-methyltransferase [Butyrivibrio sp.]MCM1343110.1 16S rRNA (uracil(1498)-N(3))-methyltransferase [Muribaculaceae bacterium]MCM1237938.1 16S rRNA (uracil(1498)-N(3))-methyltransferase [Lachnospiraceae bacterium]
MYQFFVDPSQINIHDKRVIIQGTDVNHIRNVLRMKPGEELNVSNGQDGKEYRCAVEAFEEDRVICQLRFVKEDNVELPSRVYLFQALPKADKMELIIQKAVELGVHRVIPVAARRCVVRLDEKKAAAKTARWQAIAQTAAKQSRRGIIPEVAEVMDFARAVKLAADMDVKLIPYELAEGMEQTRERIDALRAGQDIALFIGPEGGFEEAEIQLAADNGIVPITLGKRILRTETAGMTVLSWIMYRLEGK